MFYRYLHLHVTPIGIHHQLCPYFLYLLHHPGISRTPLLQLVDIPILPPTHERRWCCHWIRQLNIHPLLIQQHLRSVRLHFLSYLTLPQPASNQMIPCQTPTQQTTLPAVCHLFATPTFPTHAFKVHITSLSTSVQLATPFHHRYYPHHCLACSHCHLHPSMLIHYHHTQTLLTSWHHQPTNFRLWRPCYLEPRQPNVLQVLRFHI